VFEPGRLVPDMTVIMGLPRMAVSHLMVRQPSTGQR
jgi:hypothetical protein